MVRVKGNAMLMHLLEVADLVPGREARGESPAFDREADAAKERVVRVVGAPEGVWEGCWVVCGSGWGSRYFSDNWRRREVAAGGE